MTRKKLLTVFGIASLAGLLMHCGQEETAFTPQDATGFAGKMTGRVVDRHGAPVSGALVTAFPGGATTASTVDGSYELSGLAAGKYRLSYSKADYLDTIRPDSVTVGMLQTDTLGAAQLHYRYATVKGTVVDRSGAALPTAGVVVENQNASTSAVSQGSFTLMHVEPGLVRLFAALTGAGYGYKDVDLKADTIMDAGAVQLDHMGGTVSGTVTDSVGNAIANAVVTAAGGGLKTTSKSDGSYRLTNVPTTTTVVVDAGSSGKTAVTGVTVLEGGSTSLPAVSVAPAVGLSASALPTLLPGVALGATTDKKLLLQVQGSLGSDSAWQVLRYLWSVDGGTTWIDSTTSGTWHLNPAQLPGWRQDTTGKYSVTVRARVYKTIGAVVQDSVTAKARITVQLTAPPDRMPPTIKRISPASDTTMAWKDSVVTVAWNVTDDRRLGTVLVDGDTVVFNGGLLSRQYTLGVGRTIVRLVARDSAGNVAQDSLVLVRKAAVVVPHDSTLASLSVISTSGMKLSGFVPKVTSYTDTVASTDTSVTVSAVANDSMSKVTINGSSLTTVRLPDTGAANVRIVVKAVDGDSLAYMVNVIRKAAVAHDSTLKSLSVISTSGVTLSSFSPKTLSYQDSVASTDTLVTVSAMASDSLSKVTANGVNGSDSVSTKVRLSDTGATNIRIVVKATDGDSLAYVVRVVHRASIALPWNTSIIYGSLTDGRDKQVYKTVKIGKQTWMAENLNYRNTTGSTDTVGMCYNNSADSCAKYGRLYTWADAMGLALSYNGTTWGGNLPHQGVCPDGWHVPSDAEWQTLEMAAGMSVSTVSLTEWRGSDEGVKLKSSSGWTSGNGTDVYGFRVLPSGTRSDGQFGGTGDNTRFNSASESSATLEWGRDFWSDKNGIKRIGWYKSYSWPLRCIQSDSDTLVTLHMLFLDSGSLSPSFDSTHLSYTDSVASTVTSLHVTATASSISGTVKINSGTVASDAATLVNVATDTTITILVGNPNIASTKTYLVRVVHKAVVSSVSWNTSINYGSLTDARDGQVYRTVKIGTQTWMAENLNFTTTTGNSWKYTSNVSYGRHYDWVAAMGDASSCYSATCSNINGQHKGACPDDWHVPSVNDWNVLKAKIRSDYKVDTGNEGEYLRATVANDTFWNNKSYNAGDPYGFRILPAGWYGVGGPWGNQGIQALFWTSNESDASDANILYVGYVNSSKLIQTTNTKAGGLSLRCIQNSTDTLTTLHSLFPDSGSLSPSFDSTHLSYTDSVASTATSLHVTATASSTSDTVKVNGAIVASETATSVNVATDTTIAIVVSNPNTSTTHTYMVRVVHKIVAAHDSSLVRLSVRGLSGNDSLTGFAKGILSYQDTVVFADTAVTISATPSDASDTVAINGVFGTSRLVALGTAGSTTTVRVCVKATDGDSLVYTVNVVRRGNEVDTTLQTSWTFPTDAADSTVVNSLYAAKSSSEWPDTLSTTALTAENGAIHLAVTWGNVPGWWANAAIVLPLDKEWRLHDLSSLRSISFSYRTSDIKTSMEFQFLSPQWLSVQRDTTGKNGDGVMLTYASGPATNWKTVTIDPSVDLVWLDWMRKQYAEEATQTWSDVSPEIKSMRFRPMPNYNSNGTTVNPSTAWIEIKDVTLNF